MKKIVITGGLGYIGTELCKIYSGYSWNDKIIVIGCNPKASPKIFGSMTFPIIWWIIAGKNIIKSTEDKSVYCKIAIGIGNKTAMIEPTTGIKLSIKVKEPKIKANSKPKNQ